jgi:WD40 repeat protein
MAQIGEEKPSMAWPLSQDYNEAIQNPHLCFADDELRAGQAATNALGIPMPRSGNFADVYEVRCPLTDSRWAVKCFTRPIPGLRERYAAISAHLQQTRPRFAVDFQFLEQGVRVHGQWYPVLKMQWVEGLLLNEFVRDALDRPSRLAALAEVWVRLARRLREAGLAHGDLQHGNVLLVPDPNAASLHLRLVDYDGTFVPALAGQRSGEVGHPAYQHPQRLQEGTYNAEVDRFPLLVVYIAIRALMIGGRALWERYNNGDNLLFQQQDLRCPRESALVWELVRLNDPEVRRLIDHLSRAACKPLDQTPLLDDVLGNGPVPAAPASPRSASPSAVNTSDAAPAAPWYAQARPVASPSAPASARTGRGVPRRENTSRRRRLTVALVAGFIAGVCVVLTGLAFWALSLPRESRTDAAGLAQQMGGASSHDRPALTTETVRGRQPDVSKVDGLPDRRQAPIENKGPHTIPEGAFSPAGREPAQPPPPPAEKQPGAPKKEPPLADKEAPGAGQAPSTSEPSSRAVPDLLAGQGPAVGEIRRLEGHAGEVRRLAISSDGRRLLTAGWDSNVYLWDVATGRQVLKIEGHTEQVHGVAFLPGDKRALSCGQDKTLRLWDLWTAQEIRLYRGHIQGIIQVVVSRDGRLALTGGLDTAAILWDIETGKEVRRLEGHTGGVESVAFSPDGRSALTGAIQGPIRLWDIETGMERCRMEGHVGNVMALAFSPDGRFVLSGGMDRTVRLWRVKDAREERRFEGHSQGVLAVAFSPDGHRVLTGSGDETVRLWDVATSQELHRFQGHKRHVWSVAFSPDGRYAFSGGFDQTVRVWRLPPAVSSSPVFQVPAGDAKQPVERVAKPEEAALAVAEKEIKEAHKSEYSRGSPAEWRALAARLLQEGITMNAKPTARFVLFREARDLAARACDLTLALRAAQELANNFTVDAIETKTAALELACGSASTPIDRLRIAELALTVVEEVQSADNYDAASRLLKVAQATPLAAHKSLQVAVHERATEVEFLSKAHESVKDAVRLLSAKPDDPDANLAVGRFRCLQKGDWDRDLPLLARGSDPKLKDLARKDLTAPDDAAQQVDLGNSYLALGEVETGTPKTQLLRRACYWYQQAEPRLTGLARDEVTKKLANIEESVPALRPTVLHAAYGADNTWVDVTATVRRLLTQAKGRKLTIKPGDLGTGDPAFGKFKALAIVYRHRDRVRLSLTGDAETATIPAAAGTSETDPGRPRPGQELIVLYARYGADSTWADATARAQGLVSGPTLTVNADNHLAIGDPAFGKFKALVLVYRYAGEVRLSLTGCAQTAAIGPVWTGR